MVIITEYAHARAGLIGNPSDGYFGKTIYFTFSDLKAYTETQRSSKIVIVPGNEDCTIFNNLTDLALDSELYGYCGGIRLLRACIKRFDDYCSEKGVELRDENFTIKYGTYIPRCVGLAGSSAIITACLRGLMKFYDIEICEEDQAKIVWETETKELKLAAGLQDRVVQVKQGLVYMDFTDEEMARNGYGKYEEMNPNLLPDMFIAFRTDFAGESTVPHTDLRTKFILY
ncbi:MAG: hypothetical protein J4473_01945 [Candidatus Aenigmarchaeota archaeon]|nr:hypothetical protein [Candidatus Aenigmarchaeota archaeon]